jgi:signal transduction histidine kinase
MQELISNVFRGSVTSLMNVLLLFTLTKSKGRGSTALAAVIVFLTDFTITFYLYLHSNLTTVSRANLIMFIVLGICLKPLSKDNGMQWAFNYLTTLNIMMGIVILSFHLGRLFPHPHYANTAIRLVLYLLVILLFHHRLLPLYQSASLNWPIFSVLVFCIFLILSYYFYVPTDIQHTLVSAKTPLLLLVLLITAAYGTVFYSLKRFSAMHALETENLNMQHERGLLSQAATIMADRLEFMDKVAQQNSLATHDRRHFNSMLLNLLDQGELEEARTYLKQQLAQANPQTRVYCQNKAVNAAICYYIAKAEASGVSVETTLDIPIQLPFDSVELALVVSNLLENAIQAVQLLPQDQARTIHFTCRHKGRLLLEMSNPCPEHTTLDHKGLPFSSQNDHGLGTKSVVAFANKYHAELLYSIKQNLFTVRLLIDSPVGPFTPSLKG